MYAPLIFQKNPEAIRVFKLEEFNQEKDLQNKSKEFYRITFTKNKENRNSDLSFINPGSVGLIKQGQQGFVCLFSKSFFTEVITDKLNTLHIEKKVSYVLDEKQDSQLNTIFTNMLNEINSQYTYKYDLLRNYISEITHIAIKSLAGK